MHWASPVWGNVWCLITLNFTVPTGASHSLFQISDPQVADITFNFWYRLSECLYKENNLQLNGVFKPYVERLIIALCRHCQFDTDHVSSQLACCTSLPYLLFCILITNLFLQEGIPEDGDEFVDFRSRVVELVKDVVFIVGSSTVFAQVSVLAFTRMNSLYTFCDTILWADVWEFEISEHQCIMGFLRSCSLHHVCCSQEHCSVSIVPCVFQGPRSDLHVLDSLQRGWWCGAPSLASGAWSARDCSHCCQIHQHWIGWWAERVDWVPPPTHRSVSCYAFPCMSAYSAPRCAICVF